jgi:hypothetical protein
MVAAAAWWTLGCEGASEAAKPSSGTDADADTDADTDVDSDSDADSDSDSDADTSTDPAADNDNDGLSNGFEEELGTDPNDSDSDDDGVSDLVEWVAGTDPLDPDSNPQAEGNFYFLVPYNNAPDPTEDTLEFATDIQTADLFFLMDTTASMGGEIDNLMSSLSTFIIPEVEDIIGDIWYGVGRFDDYPQMPYGDASEGDVVYQLVQQMTPDPALAQTAVNTLDTHWGQDLAESTVPALYVTATGEGLGSYLDPQDSCDPGAVGYPCFRDGAIPIIMLFTDAPFHNGPGDYDAYTSITPDPPTYSEAVDALNAIHAKVLPVWSPSGYPSSVESHCISIATDTGAVDYTDNPLVFGIDQYGNGIDVEVVNAVDALAHDVPLDISALGRDDESDDVDATVFIDYITPFNENTPLCTGDLVTLDIDDDTINDVFVDVMPGTPVCFDVVPAENTTVPATGDPQLFVAFIDVLGDFITVLDTREVYFLVPPDTPIE